MLLSFRRGSSQQHCLWYGRHGAVWKIVDGACHPHVTTCALSRGRERVRWRDGERDVSPAHVSGSQFSVRQILGASFFCVLGFFGEQQDYTVSSCYYVIACMVASATVHPAHPAVWKQTVAKQTAPFSTWVLVCELNWTKEIMPTLNWAIKCLKCFVQYEEIVSCQ